MRQRIANLSPEKRALFEQLLMQHTTAGTKAQAIPQFCRVSVEHVPDDTALLRWVNLIHTSLQFTLAKNFPPQHPGPINPDAFGLQQLPDLLAAETVPHAPWLNDGGPHPA